MKAILCRKCIFWVDCESDRSFCLVRDLFTATAETECNDFQEGKPMKEQEYEDWNAAVY